MTDAVAPGSHGRQPVRLLDQVKAFQYVTVPNAPTYRAVMQVCYEAMRRYVIELRPDEILRARGLTSGSSATRCRSACSSSDCGSPARTSSPSRATTTPGSRCRCA